LNDLTGPVASFGPGPAQPVGGEFVIGGSGVDYYFLPSDFTGPTSFGAGGFTSATSSIADSFGATLANTTLADLGVDAGIYTWAWTGDPDADSFSVFAGIEPPSSGAPEPASMFLIAAGLDTLTAAARKRTRAT
jgi:hypothetical protein